MDRFKKIVLSSEELLEPGHLACQGCGAALAMKLALHAIGKNTIVVIPACCWSIIAGPFPYSALNIPVVHTAFETAAAVASAIKSAFEIKGINDINVMAWAGDGGTFDIGIQALSGSAERNDDIIYVCYDNEAYMNTGIQRSSATPYGAWTTTTPEKHYKKRPKKNIIQIMVAHSIPYIATASVAFPGDFMDKMKKASKIRGTKFIHLLSPCPPGWKIPSDMAIKVTRMATDSWVFPLYEIENEVYRLTVQPQGTSVASYLKVQGRFSHLRDDDIDTITGMVEKEKERLLRIIESQNPG